MMKTVYTDTAQEYEALRHGTGLVDHDGAALLEISGPAAAEFVGETATRTVDFLLEGQSSSMLVLDERGVVLGEVLVHCRADGYLMEAWPAQADTVRRRVREAAEGRDGVEVTDVSEQKIMLAVEGPGSFRIAGPYLDFPIASMAYRSLVETTWRDTTMIVSRTGVTGEYGYKFVVPADQAEILRTELAEAGAVEVGLDALDVCRMEMRFANLETEAGEETLPFHLGLQWMVDFDHEFVGRDALLAAWEAGIETLPVCWSAEEGAATSLSEEHPELFAGDTAVGRVTTAVHSPSLGRLIGTAAMRAPLACAGLELELDGTGHSVRTVSAPFLVATSFDTPME